MGDTVWAGRMVTLRRRTRAVRRASVAVAAVTTAVIAAATCSASAVASTPRTSAAVTGADVPVIVQASAHHVAQARYDVLAMHGRIGIDLPIINGFAATVPAAAVAGLAHAAGVRAVTPDLATHVQGSTYDPYSDAGSSVGLSYDIGYNQYWNNGYTGKGIGIALIDSGVAPVPALAASGKVYYGPDFTPTGYFSQDRSLDAFGHGTFMAGIIAGRDSAARAPYINSAAYVGVAPDAHIISVRAGDQTGASSESAVIAGIQWVVAHRNDSHLNIKVLNLSLGVRDGLAYTSDPLDAAAEAAWRAGITVVAAAGNDGAVGMTAPANDPYVIAVAAIDTGNTISMSDDLVASFSDLGDGHRNPDFGALGTHIVSLRVRNSGVDATYGTGAGSVTSTLMRGSGTSEAAAVTSGAVALLLSERPTVTPDQVKATLAAYAWKLPNLTTRNSGAGALYMAGVFGMPTVSKKQTWTPASGKGTATASGVASTTASGSMWAGSSWTSINWSGRSWTGPTWSGSMWSGSMWKGSMWSGSMWKGSVWKGSVWADDSWQTAGWQ